MVFGVLQKPLLFKEASNSEKSQPPKPPHYHHHCHQTLSFSPSNHRQISIQISISVLPPPNNLFHLLSIYYLFFSGKSISLPVLLILLLFSSLLFSTQSSLNALINFPSFRFDFLHHSAISIRFSHLSISLYHFFPKLESMNSYRIINFTSFIHSFIPEKIDTDFFIIYHYMLFSASHIFYSFLSFLF